MLTQSFIFDLTQGSLKPVLSFFRSRSEIDFQIQKNSIKLYFFDSELITISELEYHLYYIRFYNYYVPEIEGPYVSSYKFYRNDQRRFKSLLIYPRDRDNPDKIQELSSLIYSAYRSIEDIYDRDSIVDYSIMEMELHYDGINPFRQYFLRSNSINTKKEPPDIYIVDSEPDFRRRKKGIKPYDMVGVSLNDNDQIKFFIMSLILPGGTSYGRRYFNDLINQPDSKTLFLSEIFSLLYLKTNFLGLMPGLELSDEIVSGFNPWDNDYMLDYINVYYDDSGGSDPFNYLRDRLKKRSAAEFKGKIKFTTVTRKRKQLRNEFIYSIDQIFPLDQCLDV